MPEIGNDDGDCSMCGLMSMVVASEGDCRMDGEGLLLVTSDNNGCSDVTSLGRDGDAIGSPSLAGAWALAFENTTL